LSRFGEKKQIKISDMSVLLSLAEQGYINRVLYNTAVSFQSPEQIPILLAKLKRSGVEDVTITVHDYFSLCPSHFLINASGNYCRLPSPEVCNKCLSSHQDGLVSLYTKRDILAWRRLWWQAYEEATRVLCFSASSKSLLKEVYPELAENKIEVILHTVDERLSSSRIPSIDLDAPLRVGVVGAIGEHKGAAIIRGLANIIRERNSDVEICVIGSIDIANHYSDIVQQTGPYNSGQLSDFIESSGANVFLFPSIWPETFSYVTAELMALEVPVVCFDMGAPAERVSQYSKGMVIKFTEDAGLLLDHLIEFKNTQKIS
jgi:glycosyltransferase involved in cell wall biosynthesis